MNVDRNSIAINIQLLAKHLYKIDKFFFYIICRKIYKFMALILIYQLDMTLMSTLWKYQTLMLIHQHNVYNQSTVIMIMSRIAVLNCICKFLKFCHKWSYKQTSNILYASIYIYYSNCFQENVEINQTEIDK